MQPLQSFRKHVAKHVASHAETRPRLARIVDVGLDNRAFRIHTQSARHSFLRGIRRIVAVNKTAVFLILRDRIEHNMAAALHKLAYRGVCVDWAVGMHIIAEKFKRQAHLVERAGCRRLAVIAYDSKRFPESVCLECHDYLGTRLLRNVADQLQISAEFIFVNNVVWCLYLSRHPIILNLANFKRSTFMPVLSKSTVILTSGSFSILVTVPSPKRR